MKKAIISIIAIIVIASFALWQIRQSWVPDLHSYEAQKKYAGTLYSTAYESGAAGFFMPTRFASGVVLHMFTIPAFKKSLNAQLYLFKKYPKIANDDIDVLGRTGDLYRTLEKYDKALPMYERQLEVFKRKYFKNLTYPEREGLTDLQAKTEEYKYLIKIRQSIAACYNGMKQYQKGLSEYKSILQMLPETSDLDKYVRQDMFRDIFVTISKIYKAIFKEYDLAIENYEEFKKTFPTPMHESMADVYIGDTYLAMGDVNKAKEIYQEVVNKYKYPNSTGDYSIAQRRLKELQEDGPIIATDGLYYEIKDGKVITRFTASKRIVSVSEIKQ